MFEVLPAGEVSDSEAESKPSTIAFISSSSAVVQWEAWGATSLGESREVVGDLDIRIREQEIKA